MEQYWRLNKIFYYVSGRTPAKENTANYQSDSFTILKYDEEQYGRSVTDLKDAKGNSKKEKLGISVRGCLFIPHVFLGKTRNVLANKHALNCATIVSFEQII